VPSQRREERAAVKAQTTHERERSRRQLGTEGDRPTSPFGGVPVSEIAILAGIVAVAVWFFSGGSTTLLVVGLVVCTLGVVEVTAREHFSGFRSHASLLAGIPAVAAGIGIVSAVGEKTNRAPLLIAVAGPLFALLFWFLRRRFQIARQARVVRGRRA
jgi:hypothetical protein